MTGPDLLAGRERALRSLELSVKRKLEGFLHGEITGLRSGPGSEPNEARPYQAGQDDVRRMDWNVTARSLEPHVRAPSPNASWRPGPWWMPPPAWTSVLRCPRSAT